MAAGSEQKEIKSCFSRYQLNLKTDILASQLQEAVQGTLPLRSRDDTVTAPARGSNSPPCAVDFVHRAGTMINRLVSYGLGADQSSGGLPSRVGPHSTFWLVGYHAHHAVTARAGMPCAEDTRCCLPAARGCLDPCAPWSAAPNVTSVVKAPWQTMPRLRQLAPPGAWPLLLHAYTSDGHSPGAGLVTGLRSAVACRC